jgi:hypothetical protein
MTVPPRSVFAAAARREVEAHLEWAGIMRHGMAGAPAPGLN